MAARGGIGLVGRFLGSAVSEAAAFAAGVALGPVLGPPVQAIRNEVNAQYPFVPIAPGVLAEGVAQGQIDHDVAQVMAGFSGINSENFDHMVSIANVGPGTGYAFELFRRDILNETGFRRAVKRLGIEAEWIDDLVKLKDVILTPGELAAAIHRGLVPDAGLLLGEQPEPPFKVDAYPVQDIDPLAEAAGSGFDRERLHVLVGLQGLPMGPHEAAQALFRGIITHGDYIRAFNTSNMRNEWAQAILDQTRQIPTARDFLENALRGYSNLDDAIAGAKRHGMSEADATLIYQNQGRPMNVHQITQALARGAKFNPEPGELTDPYKASIVEGPIKPAYYEMAEALKYTLPSAFVMRQLAASGVWSEAKTAERLKWAGWFPDDADEAAKAWANPSAADASDPREKLAVTQAVASIKKQFMIERMTAQEAIDGMTLLGVTAASAGRIIETWTVEHGWTEKPLTAAQVKKAYSAADITIDDALDRLVRLRYTVADAQLYLTT